MVQIRTRQSSSEDQAEYLNTVAELINIKLTII